MEKIALEVSALKYGALSLALAVLVRVLVGVAKALAMTSGDLRPLKKDGSVAGAEAHAEGWWLRFARNWWLAFSGFKSDQRVNDYWLMFVIGWAEVAAYGFFIALGRFEVIGGWIAIKTAGGWKEWSENRATFNRFLLGNLLVLAASFFCLAPLLSVGERSPLGREPGSVPNKDTAVPSTKTQQGGSRSDSATPHSASADSAKVVAPASRPPAG